MQIYLAKPGGQKEGPFTLEQINRDLATRKYSENDYWAWHEGLPGWLPLHALPGILPRTPAVPAPAAPEPRQPSAPAPRAQAVAAKTESATAPAPAIEPRKAVTVPEPVSPVLEKSPAVAARAELATAPAPPAEPKKAAPVPEPVSAIIEKPAAVSVTARSAAPGAVGQERGQTARAMESSLMEPTKSASPAAAAAPARPEPSHSPKPEAPPELPFSALDQVFLLTSGEGRGVFESPIVAHALRDMTGEPVNAVRTKVSVDVIGHVDLGIETVHEGSVPDKAWRPMAAIKPTVTQQARDGAFEIRVRLLLDEANDVVALILFYNKRKL